MSASDLVLHIGMQQSGATMLQRALSRLRPQLRANGVAFIGHRRLGELEHRAGWRCDAAADPAQAGAFEQELAEVVAHEQAKVAEATGAPARVVLLSSDHLVGSANLDAGDDEQFRPHAEPAISHVISALAAERVRLVLYTHRQDRLMEYCYLREIQKGAHHPLAEQFPHRFDPVLDYPDLIARLQKIPHVNDVRVRPFELAAAGAAAFVDDLLAAVDLRGALDLQGVTGDLSPHHVYSRRGLRIALGMNPHLETARDRKLVREFLLKHFAAADDRQSRFLPKRERRRILAAYREQNRELFRLHMPDLPADSYDDNDATTRLTATVRGPGSDDSDGHDGKVNGTRASGGLAGALPLLTSSTAAQGSATAQRPAAARAAGPAARAADTATTALRAAAARSGAALSPLVARGGAALSPLVAHLADRLPLLYRAKVRLLARRCDAFLVSFPKCGRTWLRMMLGSALSEHFGIKVRNLRRFTDADVVHPGLPRVLATHDDSPQVKPPHQIMRDKRAYRGRKVILLVRDPRDAIVSLYFHVTRRRQVPYDGSLAEFVRERSGGLASLLAFYDAWAEHLDDDHVLLVRYEDLHAAPARELGRALTFLDVTGVDEAVIERAVSASSFDRLQRMEREGSATTRALQTATTDDPESYKVRRGKVGGYVDYLDAAEIAALDAAIARSAGARALGYTTAPDGGNHDEEHRTDVS